MKPTLHPSEKATASSQPDCLTLVDITTAPDQIGIFYDLDGLRFSNTLWYEGIDFDDLADRFGHRRIDRILFHIAAFEINKLCSLRPRRLDWGKFGKYVDADFSILWRQVFENVWAQWRFENDDPDYKSPDFEITGTAAADPIRNRPADAGSLSFCGGGKDSLVAMKLLTEINQAFSTLTYSASYYGQSGWQHDIIAELLDSIGVKNRHRQWVFDDFLDSPVLASRAFWDVKTLTAAETPSSIFGVLPYILDRGYRYACLAHERSADAPQVIWDKTGEPINHQWGKSFEAETLLNRYIQNTLIGDFDYFSILKPIHDVAIFGILRGSEAQIPFTHSCNMIKPWCRRCPKCLYVWLGYAAFLDTDTVRATFGPENLFDIPENTLYFRQLAGLEDQLPFECIGEAKEAALFLKMAEAKGWRGCAINACVDAWQSLDWPSVATTYLQRFYDDANLPDAIAVDLQNSLDTYALKTRAYIDSVLS